MVANLKEIGKKKEDLSFQFQFPQGNPAMKYPG